MKPGLLLLLFSLLLLCQCKYEEGFEQVRIDDEYEISIPHYLKKTSRLDQTKSGIQYENRFRTFYLICVGEPKKQSLAQYTKHVLDGFSKVDNLTVTGMPGKKDLNGMPAIYHELNGIVAGQSVYYYLVIVETEDKLYQICLWTLDKKKETHLPAFKQIVNSFTRIS